VTAKAVSVVRAGGGPYYVEFDTYRFREHCGPNYDNNIGYRTEEEFLTWRARCPIETYEQRLASQLGLGGDLAGIRGSIESEINAAFEFAKASPWPDVSEALAGVYADGDQ